MLPDAVLTANPLLNLGFKIPFDHIRPEHAEPAVDALLAVTREKLEWLAAAPERNFESFMDDLDTLTDQLDTVNTIVAHLDGVVTSDDWKATRKAIIPKVSEFRTMLSLHPGLWAALKAYAATPGAAALDPVRVRHLKLTIDDFRRGGADLPQAGRERLTALNTTLAEITNEFGKNVLDATAAYELYVPTERLAGVPVRVQDATRRDAEEHGREGHRLTLHYPVYGPVMTYADDRALRHELWAAQGQVGRQEGRDNRPLIREILALRREKAQLLGFRNFADYVLQDRMAGGGDAALA
ncbi:M3 family metallopeptidase, partial [Deinococcus sp.]|uniref:M3 family metallopeptidase n=1 Tax=Deinococcus sp. TaxID=47478 RepID=UPI002869D141